jgi:hypothetical protein
MITPPEPVLKWEVLAMGVWEYGALVRDPVLRSLGEGGSWSEGVSEGRWGLGSGRFNYELRISN